MKNNIFRTEYNYTLKGDLSLRYERKLQNLKVIQNKSTKKRNSCQQ